MSAIPTPPPQSVDDRQALPHEQQQDRRPSVPPSEGFSADSERTVADTPELDEKKLRRSLSEDPTLSDVAEKPPQSPSHASSPSPHLDSQLDNGKSNTNDSSNTTSDETIGRNDGKKRRIGWHKHEKKDRDEGKKDKDDVEAQRAPDIYDRFPPRKKKLIVAIVAYSAFLGREYEDPSGPLLLSTPPPPVPAQSHSIRRGGDFPIATLVR